METQRTPRPQGSTFLATKARESNNDEDKQRLLRHLVTHYTTTGFRWNGVSTNINQLSHILKVPIPDIMELVSETGTHMGSLASPENIKNTLQTITTLMTSFALEDRGLIMQQLSLLQQSQDGKYKPFITAEVNKALKLALESNKNIQDIFKSLTSSTSSSTNIINIFGENQEEEQEKEQEQNYLTPDQAIQMLSQSASTPSPDNPKSLPASSDHNKADTSELADRLGEEYGIADLIDVRERRSGTKAIQAPEPRSPSALRPPADDQTPNNQHDNHYNRRGLDIEDTDSLPTE